MYTASICIPISYEEEIVFLKRNLKQIKQFKHKDVETEVIVVDQTDNAIASARLGLSTNLTDGVKYITCPRIDAGWPIDATSRIATGEYFISLDVDCLPIHPNWLYAPIKLIEKHGILFVGKQTGLHLHPGYSKWGNFVQINNYFRVSKTSSIKELSTAVGFCRPENRYKINFSPSVNCTFEANADNGVVANFYSDQINMGPKVSLAMNRILGMTNQMGVFGHTVDDLVWHMVFSSSRDWIQNKGITLGEAYMSWYKRIHDTDFSDETFVAIIAALVQHHQTIYDREIYENGVLRSLTPQDEIFRDFSSFKKEG